MRQWMSIICFVRTEGCSWNFLLFPSLILYFLFFAFLLWLEAPVQKWGQLASLSAWGERVCWCTFKPCACRTSAWDYLCQVKECAWYSWFPGVLATEYHIFSHVKNYLWHYDDNPKLFSGIFCVLYSKCMSLLLWQPWASQMYPKGERPGQRWMAAHRAVCSHF